MIIFKINYAVVIVLLLVVGLAAGYFALAGSA